MARGIKMFTDKKKKAHVYNLNIENHAPSFHCKSDIRCLFSNCFVFLIVRDIYMNFNPFLPSTLPFSHFLPRLCAV